MNSFKENAEFDSFRVFMFLIRLSFGNSNHRISRNLSKFPMLRVEFLKEILQIDFPTIDIKEQMD